MVVFTADGSIQRARDFKRKRVPVFAAALGRESLAVNLPRAVGLAGLREAGLSA